MSKQEQWVDDVFKSIEHIERAKPEKDLLTGVLAQLKTVKQPKIVPLKRLGWIAVAASVVIALNIYVLDQRRLDITKTTETYYEPLTIISDYDLYE